MYILLSGKPPFDGGNNDEILRAVSTGKVSFDEPLWNNISLEGRDFLSKLLCFHSINRITAFQALQHPWFKKLESGVDSSEQKNLNVMGQLRNFNGRMKLQQAALAFVSAHMLTEQEKNTMKKIFESLDKNLDGALSKHEITLGLQRLGMKDAKE